MKKSFFLLTICSIIFSLILTGCSGGNVQTKAKVSESKEHKKELEYKITLTQTLDTINSTYTTTKPMSDLVSNLWHDVIFGNVYQFSVGTEYGMTGESIDKFFKSLSTNSLIPSIRQGNIEVAYLLALTYEKENGTLDKIERLKNSAQTQVDKLKNPPKNYKDVYNKILVYYADMNSYVDLTKQPQGNYEQHTTKMNDLSVKLQSQYTELKMMIK